MPPKPIHGPWPALCDWGDCDEDAITWRLYNDRWLPVCKGHMEIIVSALPL